MMFTFLVGWILTQRFDRRISLSTLRNPNNGMTKRCRVRGDRKKVRPLFRPAVRVAYAVAGGLRVEEREPRSEENLIWN